MRARDLCAGAWLLLPFSLALLSAGCHNNARSELVEAELRTREIQLHSLRDELCRLEGSNVALQREVQALRGGGFGGHFPPGHFPPEEAARTLTLRSISLARGTGGIDEDGKPGDETLQVVVDARDIDGHPLKAPGTLLIQALAVTPEGLKQPVSSWEIPPEQLRRTWKSGLLTTGYSLTLPWKALPTSDKVRVVARLVLPDGRAYEAEKDITVRLVPGLAFQTMPREGETPRQSAAPVIGPAVPLPPGAPVEGLLTPPATLGPVLQPPPVLPPPLPPQAFPPSPAPPASAPAPAPAPAQGPGPGPALAPEPTWPAPPPRLIDPPLKTEDPQLPPDMARRSAPASRSPALARTAARERTPAPGQGNAHDTLSRAVHLERPVPVPQRVEWAR